MSISTALNSLSTEIRTIISTKPRPIDQNVPANKLELKAFSINPYVCKPPNTSNKTRIHNTGLPQKLVGLGSYSSSLSITIVETSSTELASTVDKFDVAGSTVKLFLRVASKSLVSGFNLP